MFRSAFSFKGRSRRIEFAVASLLLVSVALAIGIASAPKVPAWYWAFIELPCIWLLLAQGVKRCHDLGKHGWWFWVPFYVLVMLFAEGQKHTNDFGPVPKR